MNFPHPCTHCGFCCIAVVCPVGMHLMGIPKQGPCPALEWDEADPNQSRCGLLAHPERHVSPPAPAAIRAAPMAEIMGSGVGCCVSARVIDRGITHDFAALPPETKTTYVRALRNLP